MKYSQRQIEALIKEINRKVVLFSTSLGVGLLNDQEKEILKLAGFKLDKLYNLFTDPLFLQYQLGMISRVIGDATANKISMAKLTDIIKTGQHIPLTLRELDSLESIKRQSLNDIRALSGRIFTDVNNSILSSEKNNRTAYEEVIRDEIQRGLVERKSRKEVAQELGRRTGDWARNFNRIVQYVSHQAFSEGRLAIQERKYGKEGRIYMDVYAGACKHCIKLYLTKGIGSQPIIFTIKQLMDNGTNIGRKTDELKAVIPPLHPFCRCTPNSLEEGEEWDEEKKAFIVPQNKEYKSKIRTSQIEVTFNGKQYLV